MPAIVLREAPAAGGFRVCGVFLVQETGPLRETAACAIVGPHLNREVAMENAVGFRVTGGKGFHVTFENGWTVSVQFGRFNYCANRADLYDIDVGNILERDREAGGVGSATAETAVWGPDGKLVKVDWCMGDSVQGWQSPSAVLRLMTWAASQPVTAEVAP